MKSLSLLRLATIFYKNGKMLRVFRKYDDHGNRMTTYRACSQDVWEDGWLLGEDCKDVDTYEASADRYEVASIIADCCWQDNEDVASVLIVDEYLPYKRGRLSTKEEDMVTISQRFWIDGRYVASVGEPQIAA